MSSKEIIGVVALVAVTAGAYLYLKKKDEKGVLETSVFIPDSTSSQPNKNYSVYDKTTANASDRFLNNPSGGVLDRAKQQSISEIEAKNRIEETRKKLKVSDWFTEAPTINELQKKTSPSKNTNTSSISELYNSVVKTSSKSNDKKPEAPKVSSGSVLSDVKKSVSSIANVFVPQVTNKQSINPTTVKAVTSSPIVKSLSSIKSNFFG